MAAINAQQIKKIYAIGNALGIVERGNDEDDLHAMVSAMTGKDSIKALTYHDPQPDPCRDRRVSDHGRGAWLQPCG